MLKKRYITGFTAIALCSAALAAHATPLTIVNNTNTDSTTRIHNILNKCSSDLLGEAGITRAGKTNTVSEGNIKAACLFSPNNCVADVYASANCGCPVIATMTFSTSEGVKSIEMKSGQYRISASGFHVVIDQVG